MPSDESNRPEELSWEAKNPAWTLYKQSRCEQTISKKSLPIVSGRRVRLGLKG